MEIKNIDELVQAEQKQDILSKEVQALEKSILSSIELEKYIEDNLQLLRNGVNYRSLLHARMKKQAIELAIVTNAINKYKF